MPEPPAKERKPKLVPQLRVAIRLRQYSPRTEKTYVSWVRRFIEFHGRRHPAEMGATEVTRFLEHLVVEKEVGASTQNQALSAIVFFYRYVLGQELGAIRKRAGAKVPRRVPVVLTPDEVVTVLEHMRGRARCVAELLYGSGMRLSEALGLRVKDLDLAQRQAVIRDGKGGKDRLTVIPDALVDALEGQLRFVGYQHRGDLAHGAGWVELPGALARKYPAAGRSWGWQWVFPATRRYRHEESGQWRRHHLDPTVVQRRVADAVRRSGLAKRVTCHTFRHSFATQLLRDGYDIRTIQKLLGHKDVKTTMIYTHVAGKGVLGVKSPRDRLKLRGDP